jgi:LPXTG-motif cell wall-anchored protein
MRSARFVRALVTAGAVATLATVGGSPAHAQAQATLDAFFPDVTVSATGPGVVDRVIVLASEPVVLEDVVMTFDFSAVASFVTVTEDRPEFGHCTATAATVLTCEVGLPVRVDPITSTVPDVLIAVTPAAAEGDEGILRVTVQADDFPPISYESRIRVGTGVNLAGGPTVDREVGLGESFTHAVQVTNVGETEVNGVGLTFDTDFAIRATQKYSNCTYRDDRPLTCRFDQVLSPGATYLAELPLMARLDTMAPSRQNGFFLWLTSAEFEDELNRLTSLGVDVGQPGTGGPLELTEVSTFGAASVDADVQPSNNWTALALNVTGQSGFDLAAVGDTLTGGVGDLVTAEVGIRNNGPATVDRSRIGSSAARVHVTIPPGTTAVTVSSACLPRRDDGRADPANPGQPGRQDYICAGSSMILPAGEAVTFEITLRIDQVIPDAAGAASIFEPCACDDLPVSLDLDHSNNLAKILVNPTATGGPGTLPDTGRSIGTIVATGAVLLLLGTAVVAYTARRRRRTAA